MFLFDFVTLLVIVIYFVSYLCAVQFVDGNTDTIWFVNFYSTQCSHCHDLAPIVSVSTRSCIFVFN